MDFDEQKPLGKDELISISDFEGKCPGSILIMRVDGMVLQRRRQKVGHRGETMEEHKHKRKADEGQLQMERKARSGTYSDLLDKTQHFEHFVNTTHTSDPKYAAIIIMDALSPSRQGEVIKNQCKPSPSSFENEATSADIPTTTYGTEIPSFQTRSFPDGVVLWQ
ncbi:hypothetical protein B0H34DRAFT_676792 [Crassisporium funariophilum]|nr:hypothetical protein B0H34DRAFT_676792 [Crassisporium funariophilum]